MPVLEDASCEVTDDDLEHTLKQFQKMKQLGSTCKQSQV